jgi:mRNA-degrading endonuclease RelE of RelBE toxin-antitoxin system
VTAFTDTALDDLRRLGPDAVPQVLKKVLLLEGNREAGYPLGGELTGFRKLVVGRNTWRVVYRVTDEKHVEMVHTVGMTLEDVAALDLERAVDLWADFRARSR